MALGCRDGKARGVGPGSLTADTFLQGSHTTGLCWFSVSLRFLIIWATVHMPFLGGLFIFPMAYYIM